MLNEHKQYVLEVYVSTLFEYAKLFTTVVDKCWKKIDMVG